MQQQLQLSLISHEIDNTLIHQRAADGYINATAMCKAVGKNFADYQRLKTTEAFFTELAGSMGIPIDQLVFTNMVGRNEERGTWVHPDVAIHLGQWCSPKFAVAVAKWVREWVTGKAKVTSLPYHVERYIANMSEIPPTHFSMLNEMIFGLIAPLEKAGYTIPETMVPDISEGKMFCKWLRDEKGVDTDALPTYFHRYADGRVVRAKLYPLSLLAEFRTHFYEVWFPKRARSYFAERDEKALPFLEKALSLALGEQPKLN